MELLIPEIQKQTIIGTKGVRDMKRLIESTTGDFRKISSDEKGGAILKAAGIMWWDDSSRSDTFVLVHEHDDVTISNSS